MKTTKCHNFVPQINLSKEVKKSCYPLAKVLYLAKGISMASRLVAKSCHRHPSAIFLPLAKTSGFEVSSSRRQLPILAA